MNQITNEHYLYIYSKCKHYLKLKHFQTRIPQVSIIKLLIYTMNLNKQSYLTLHDEVKLQSNINQFSDLYLQSLVIFNVNAKLYLQLRV